MSGQPLPKPQPGVETTNAAPIEQQPQPEVPPDNGIDPELQRALENPKIRALLEHEAQTAQWVRQGYAQATQEAAQIAAASVYAAFSELQGLNGDQRAGAGGGDSKSY